MSDSFYVPPEQITGGRFLITADEAKHLYSVSRLRGGDRIDIFDGKGMRYLARLDQAGPEEAAGTIVEHYPENNEPDADIYLGCALLKKDNYDWVIEKGTELGAAGFVPFTTSRTIVKMDGKKQDRRLSRWRKIALEAVKQCRRSRIPTVTPVISFGNVLSRTREFGLTLIPCMTEKTVMISSLEFPKAASILILVGPEGGFTETEVTAAGNAGAVPVSLGSRRLRSETACLTALCACTECFKLF